jgi:hypothetical protein
MWFVPCLLVSLQGFLGGADKEVDAIILDSLFVPQTVESGRTPQT